LLRQLHRDVYVAGAVTSLMMWMWMSAIAMLLGSRTQFETEAASPSRTLILSHQQH
jgi:uncharacterized BrkB/YihY/UPF0761 family membrane protein